MKVVLASGNKGKLAEFQAMFTDSKIEILPQSSFEVIEAEETGLSFIENAILKARNASAQTLMPALADDSGLAVQALKGAPGIFSARYAGEPSNDLANIRKLLEDMASIEADQRQAQFICALAFVRHAEDPVPVVAVGYWNGEILSTPSGSEGFGYDPVFYVPSESCSAAQLSKARKNALSHRGQALKELYQQFETLGLL